MTKRQPMKAYVVYQNKAQLEWAGCHFTRQSAKEAVGDLQAPHQGTHEGQGVQITRTGG